jgi:O-antigen ligase
MFIQRVEQPTQPSDRDIIYKGAKEIMFKHPFLGYGPRTFKEVFPFPDQFADKGVGGWHNDILQIYFESGLLGLISFIALLYFIIYCIVKMLRRKIKAEISGILYGILFSICGFILSSMTAGFITSVVISIVFVFIVSILSSIAHNTKIKEPQENI